MSILFVKSSKIQKSSLPIKISYVTQIGTAALDLKKPDS